MRQTPTDSPLRAELGRPPFVWAHRGASALAPENTVRAFLLAAELGARGIELDVHLSRDGVPVVLHDTALWADDHARFLHRPDGAEAGRARRLVVAKCDWAELEAIPVTHPDGSSEKLARLEEVLDAVPDWLWIDVELKAGAIYDPRLVEVVLGCLRLRPERVLVSSFDHIALAEVAAAEPTLPLSALCNARFADPRPVLQAIPASMICVRRSFIVASDVERFGTAGFEVSVYGQEILLDLADLLSWPVAGIFLDDPRLASIGTAGAGPSGAGGAPTEASR